jgi:hypothetical protein
LILNEEIISDLGTSSSHICILGGGQIRARFISADRMNLEAIDICVHQLGEVSKVHEELVPDFFLGFDERSGIQMCSITYPLNCLIIDARVILIVFKIHFDGISAVGRGRENREEFADF